jgi:hypothetical protein
MGFAKAFGYADLPQLTQPISRAWGVAWLVAACLMTMSTAMLGAGARNFWMVGACTRGLAGGHLLRVAGRLGGHRRQRSLAAVRGAWLAHGGPAQLPRVVCPGRECRPCARGREIQSSPKQTWGGCQVPSSDICASRELLGSRACRTIAFDSGAASVARRIPLDAIRGRATELRRRADAAVPDACLPVRRTGRGVPSLVAGHATMQVTVECSVAGGQNCSVDTLAVACGQHPRGSGRHSPITVVKGPREGKRRTDSDARRVTRVEGHRFANLPLMT